MENLQIGIAEISGKMARVHAVSIRQINGEPEAFIELRLSSSKPFTGSKAKKLAMKYLDARLRLRGTG